MVYSWPRNHPQLLLCEKPLATKSGHRARTCPRGSLAGLETLKIMGGRNRFPLLGVEGLLAAALRRQELHHKQSSWSHQICPILVSVVTFWRQTLVQTVNLSGNTKEELSGYSLHQRGAGPLQARTSCLRGLCGLRVGSTKKVYTRGSCRTRQSPVGSFSTEKVPLFRTMPLRSLRKI